MGGGSLQNTPNIGGSRISGAGVGAGSTVGAPAYVMLSETAAVPNMLNQI
jgi:hypothetical protein